MFGEARQAGSRSCSTAKARTSNSPAIMARFPYYFASLIRQHRFAALLRAMAERHRWHGVSFADQARTYLLPLLPAGLARWLRRERQTVGRLSWLDGEVLRPHLGRSAFDTARERIGRPPIAGIGDLCVALTQSSNLAMLLHWEDRNSMAHSIEARVPFLDHRLVEFSIALGDSHKIVGGDTKRVLRRAMDGILPAKCATAATSSALPPLRKRGFGDRCGSFACRDRADAGALSGTVQPRWGQGACRCDAGRQEIGRLLVVADHQPRHLGPGVWRDRVMSSQLAANGKGVAVSLTPASLDADSRAFRIAQTLADAGFHSIVVEGRPSARHFWDDGD